MDDTVQQTHKVRIPVGPVHPSLKEPAQFNIVLRREHIGQVDLRVGFAHRGIEVLAQKRNLMQNILLAERICGICSNCHAMCYVNAIEEIGQLEVPERAQYIRVLVSELERIQSHTLWLGFVAYQIGLDTLFMYGMKHRERINDLFEELTGNRVHYGMNTIGGVRRDISPDARDKVLSVLRDFEKAARFIGDAFSTGTTEKRLSGLGEIPSRVASELCLVGPTARASGIHSDIRKDEPYAAYGALKDTFKVVTATEGDCLARVRVRYLELFESIEILRALLDQMPGGPIVTEGSEQKRMRSIPEGEAVARVEAPRGELIHYVRTNGKSGIHRLKVRAPTLANLVSLTRTLVNAEVADIPVITASIDPCISCTDR
ncbi:MAG: nickel-dependent hydrogenase large subunit [Candidatus Thorarchaeota archaeon]